MVSKNLFAGKEWRRRCRERSVGAGKNGTNGESGKKTDILSGAKMNGW